MDPTQPEVRHESLAENLTFFTTELQRYTQELNQRSKEYEELQKLLQRIKGELSHAKGWQHRIQQKHDKLHNEGRDYQSRTLLIRKESAPLPNEIRQLQQDIEKAKEEQEHCKRGISALQGERATQEHDCHTLQCIVDQAQREVQVQQRERDRARNQAAKEAKRANQLKQRIHEWTLVNHTFIHSLSSNATHFKNENRLNEVNGFHERN